MCSISAISADRNSTDDFDDGLIAVDDRDGFPRRTFSGKGTVAGQHADMVDAQAGYRIRFRWCRYFVDLRQHRTFARLASLFKQPIAEATTSRSRGSICPSFALNIAPAELRGRRECRASNAPVASRAK